MTRSTEIKRDGYLDQLISYRFDGLVKVITGIRRCGKSYLLKNIYRDYLIKGGVKEKQIITIELDLAKDIKYRNPLALCSYVKEKVEKSKEEYYLFVDEIQMSDEVANPYNPDGKKITFYDALNDLRALPNLDVYVTGSNSKMLSSDILTEFRGRSDEIRVHPLSFAEYYSAVGGDKNDAFDEYAFYGGMPLVLSRPNDAAKMNYLRSLFSEVYIKDIVERKHIERQDILEKILNLLCSSVGSLTNPTKIANTLKSKGGSAEMVSGAASASSVRGGGIANTRTTGASPNTIRAYIEHLEDAFLFSESKRYDVKGKSYFDSPNKYYAEDIGLRNARIGFRQQEMTHIMENIMENIIYNELVIRQFFVDVGVVYSRTTNANGNSVRTPREIDFVVNSGGKRTYIQSAYAMPTDEKAKTELKPFSLTGDFFPKIVVRKDIGKRWYDEQGILNINVIDFLLDKDLI